MFDGGQILKTPGISTPQAVAAVALVLNTGAVQFCLNKGGKMEYVFDAMVARRESCLEDGTFENAFDHEQSERERSRRVYLTSLFSLD